MKSAHELISEITGASPRVVAAVIARDSASTAHEAEVLELYYEILGCWHLDFK